MVDLEMILKAIDELPADALGQVKKRVEQRERGLGTPEDVEAKIAAFNEAVENFWEGFSPNQVEQIVADMNGEYIETDEDEMFGWADDLSEPKA